MTYNETMAIVYRVLNAYPFYAKSLTNQAVEGMVGEWHEGLKNIPRDGVMEAVTALVTENKWMPTLAEVIGKILDIQYGTESDIIRMSDSPVIFVAHAQTDMDDSGFQFTHIKTSGRKLDKIVLESKFSTVLLAKCADGRYVFETQSNRSTAKSPLGMFESKEIDNDINIVLKAIEEF